MNYTIYSMPICKPFQLILNFKKRVEQNYIRFVYKYIFNHQHKSNVDMKEAKLI